MKKLFFLFILSIWAIAVFAQTEDAKTLHETAKSFMRSGDFDNAVIVLTRALQQDKNSLELQKDLVMSYYLKRDYAKALEGVKALVDRDDADVVVYQLAGNVYKALEEPKECEKVYKKGLKKFPRADPCIANTVSCFGQPKIIRQLISGKKEFNSIPLIAATITMLLYTISTQKIKSGA